MPYSCKCKETEKPCYECLKSKTITQKRYERVQRLQGTVHLLSEIMNKRKTVWLLQLSQGCFIAQYLFRERTENTVTAQQTKYRIALPSLFEYMQQVTDIIQQKYCTCGLSASYGFLFVLKTITFLCTPSLH